MSMHSEKPCLMICFVDYSQVKMVIMKGHWCTSDVNLGKRAPNF